MHENIEEASAQLQPGETARDAVARIFSNAVNNGLLSSDMPTRAVEAAGYYINRFWARFSSRINGGGRLCSASGDEACSCGPGQVVVEKLSRCVSSTPRRSNRVADQQGVHGPIRDPNNPDADNAGIGSSGSGSFSGLNQACFGNERARGVPRTDCTTVTRCPDGSYKAGLGGASCSCRAIGYREGIGGNVRLPGGEQCPNGLCPGLQPAQQANRNPAQQININNPGAAQNPAEQAANR